MLAAAWCLLLLFPAHSLHNVMNRLQSTYCIGILVRGCSSLHRNGLTRLLHGSGTS